MQVKEEILELCEDIKNCSYLTIVISQEDRFPDSEQLTEKGRQIIVDALSFYAAHMVNK